MVVNSRSIYIRELLVKSSFTQPNLTYLRQQMLKVVLTDKGSVFHTLLVNDIATQRELTNDIGTLLAESHLSRTFLLNYRDFLGSCLLVQFICVIYVL